MARLRKPDGSAVITKRQWREIGKAEGRYKPLSRAPKMPDIFMRDSSGVRVTLRSPGSEYNKWSVLREGRAGVVDNQVLCAIVHAGVQYAARRSLENGEITRVDGVIIRGGEPKEETRRANWKDLKHGEVGFTSGESGKYYVYAPFGGDGDERIRRAYNISVKLGLGDKETAHRFMRLMDEELVGRWTLVETRGKVYAVIIENGEPSERHVYSVNTLRGVPSVRLTKPEDAARILRETRDQILK